MNRESENVWSESYLQIFLERFVLPILATLVVGIILLNPFKFDRQQQISLFLAVVFIAYFIGYTIHRNQKHSVASPRLEQPSVERPGLVNKTYGTQSPIMPNNSGNVKITSEPPEGGSPPVKQKRKQDDKEIKPDKTP
jgi:hypothetical protein